MTTQKMVIKCLLLWIFMLGAVWAQSEPTIKDALDSLPPELQGKVDENQIHDIKNKSTQLFREKCLKNGGLEAFAKAEGSFTTFGECLKTLVDMSTLKDEIEKAKPNGQVDEVFKKYCTKTPQFKACFHDMTEAAKPCFSTAEQKNLNTVYNVSEQLAEFVCFKDGDRIALFIAEGGPECFQEKQEEIQACVNGTFGADINIDPENLSADSIPELTFDDKECQQLSDLQLCVVKSLETCEQPTSANIVESLFKFVRKVTPCKNKETQTSKPNSASVVAVTTATIIMAAATALL